MQAGAADMWAMFDIVCPGVMQAWGSTAADMEAVFDIITARVPRCHAG